MIKLKNIANRIKNKIMSLKKMIKKSKRKVVVKVPKVGKKHFPYTKAGYKAAAKAKKAKKSKKK